MELDNAAREETYRDAIAVGRNWARFRPLIGLGGLLLLGLEWFQARDDSNLASDVEASAVQYIQLYVPHLFDAMLIIGVMIALYIVTRMAD